jgi:predicted ATPase
VPLWSLLWSSAPTAFVEAPLACWEVGMWRSDTLAVVHDVWLSARSRQRMGGARNVDMSFRVLPGTEISGYRVERQIGRGGMAAVYLATHEGLGRHVALKILVPDVGDDGTFRERFQQEARIAASIDHPNVIPLYETGEFEGLVWITMRLVDGIDLKRRLEQGTLTPAAAVTILSQVAAALDAAHRRGLVHRDVKPANILLDPGVRPDGSDHAYLADFGLARSSTSPSALTRPGFIFGTIDYMSPEQIRGGDLDGRSDVYALACVLYECLSGSPPFRRETVIDTMNGHLHDQPSALAGGTAGLPTTLDQVLSRGLAKEPADRYVEAGTFMLVAAAAMDEFGARSGRTQLQIGQDLPGEPDPLPRQETLATTSPGMSATVAAAPPRPPLSRIVGRAQELVLIGAALSQGRLVTLTGVAGGGKSRLAMEVASRAPAGDTSIVRLGLVGSERDVPEAIAAAVGLDEPTSELSSLATSLRDRAGLLILDDCEHVVAACAAAAEEILAASSDLRILATSREPLRLPGEIMVAVPPLSIPAEPRTLAEIQRSDAVQLFVERAAEVRAGFRLDAENANDVAEICVMLDGIPFAIELAAARVRSLSPGEIASRLTDRLDALSVRAVGVDRRHRTMHEAIDWSYGLLRAEEAKLLDSLSVFVGTFSVDAAEDVCSSDEVARDTVIDLLDDLVSRSLVSTDPLEGRMRYRLLEPVRRLALARLDASGRAGQLRDRHARHYAAVAERLASATGDQGPSVESVRAEIPNIRSALIRLREGEDGDRGRLAAARAAGHLAFALGDWETVVGSLVDLDQDAGLAKELGISLCKLHRHDPTDVEYRRGQELLGSAADLGDADAVAALAGTWRDVDPVRALALYERAYEMDAAHSYALGNLLEYAATADSGPVEIDQIERQTLEARRRCGEQIDAGENLPWAAFDLGKFSLLLEDVEGALLDYAFAVSRSTGPFMIDTSLRSLGRLGSLMQGTDGWHQASCLLALGLAARFPWHPPGRDAASEFATPDAGPLEPPVLVLAGWGRDVGDALARTRTTLIGALAGASLTVVSGGTTTGVSALAADIAPSNAHAAVVGYAPRALPPDVELDERYSEVRRSQGDRFGPWEPLRYWADVLSSGISASDVRMLMIGGGPIAALECRVALAFGASVGVVRGTGGSAEQVFDDPRWNASRRLTVVLPDTGGLRTFLAVG